MSYYYLVSSLPSLTLNDRPEIALDAFRALCVDHLSPRDAGALESLLNVDSVDTPPHPFTELWTARETQLRNAAARLRAAKRQEDAGTFLRDHAGFDTGLENGVEDAFSFPTLWRGNALSIRSAGEFLMSLAGTILLVRMWYLPTP